MRSPGAERVRLKNVADILVSNVDKKSVEGEVPVRLCNYTDVYYKEDITSDLDFMEATAAPHQVQAFGLQEGDVLITKDSETADDIGVPAFVPEGLDGVLCGYHLAVLRAHRDALDPRFLFWVMDATVSRRQLEVAATGITRKGLRLDSIGELSLVLPPLVEQQEISDFLDRETARLSQLTRKKRTLLDVLSTRETALIDEYTGAQRLAKNLSSGSEAVLHEGERVSRLMHLTEESRPIMYGIVLPGPDVGDGVPLIKGGNVERGALELEDLARTAEEIEAKHRRSRVKNGDIVFSIRGSAGVARRVPRTLAGANMTQDVARVSPRPGVDSDWLLYALRSTPVLAQLESGMVGATIRGINIRDLKRVRILTPASERQSEIGDVLGEHLRRIEALRGAVRSQLDLLEEHRRALVAESVSGRLPLKTA